MEIKYDVPFEVTKNQYNALMKDCSMIVAGRVDNGKYLIKVWMMKYLPYVQRILKSVK